jgi:MEMO1 family protein
VSGRDLLVRPPAVAGLFYPDDPATLATTVDAALRAGARILGDRARPDTEALIVPHAGYRYSGDVAGTAYAGLAGRTDLRRVVLLGPAHRVPVRSLAVPTVDAFATPLGPVPVDAAGRRSALAAGRTVVADDRPHAPEHSLEVHLPFLQRVLGPAVDADGAVRWSVLPFVVGRAGADEVADVLEAVWDDPGTIAVVSTDLSHYHDDATAKRLDAATAARIVALDLDHLSGDDACGAAPLRGLLALARRRGLDVELLDLRTSGDTSGERDRVVGYGAFAVAPARPDPPGTTSNQRRSSWSRPPEHPEPRQGREEGPGAGGDAGGTALDTNEQRTLLDLAREVVADGVAGRDRDASDLSHLPDLPVSLTTPAATFVTLRCRGRLLGCIGSMEPRRPLAADVAANAWSAAFADPRLPAVTRVDLVELEVKISVLGPLEPMAVSSPAELVASLRPGIDGVLVEGGRRRGTFLPSVWGQLVEVEAFVEHLWHKAGLRPGSWPPDLRVWRYGTLEFGD